MEGLIRVGKVSDANYGERTVRVHFPDVDIVSGWLLVLKSPPFIPERHQTQRTEYTGKPGEEAEAFEAHSHNVIIKPWFPEIGDNVLCIFDHGFNADGYVLGGL